MIAVIAQCKEGDVNSLGSSGDNGNGNELKAMGRFASNCMVVGNSNIQHVGV
jgi:hypothetical protein